MTSLLQARIEDHQSGVFEGFSKDYRCTRLVYFERRSGPTGAILREKQLKGWTRAKKTALIEKANPIWVDLSEAWSKPVKRYQWSREELATLNRVASPKNKQISVGKFRADFRLRRAPLRMTNKRRSFANNAARCVRRWPVSAWLRAGVALLCGTVVPVAG